MRNVEEAHHTLYGCIVTGSNPVLTALRQTAVGRSASTPLERCWVLRNYIGTLTGRYDVADEIGAMVCDLMIPYQPKDKMIDKTDDDCTEYWEQTKDYLLGGR
jgi:hypothetical protein